MFIDIRYSRYMQMFFSWITNFEWTTDIYNCLQLSWVCIPTKHWKNIIGKHDFNSVYIYLYIGMHFNSSAVNCSVFQILLISNESKRVPLVHVYVCVLDKSTKNYCFEFQFTCISFLPLTVIQSIVGSKLPKIHVLYADVYNQEDYQ